MPNHLRIFARRLAIAQVYADVRHSFAHQRAQRTRSTLLRMKRLRTLLERLPGGHRPPTGPLTNAEQTDAEELRQETLMKDNERIEREQEERGDRRDREV
jgi:hypothetical protein